MKYVNEALMKEVQKRVAEECGKRMGQGNN
jgi:hypothetical protein